MSEEHDKDQDRPWIRIKLTRLVRLVSRRERPWVWRKSPGGLVLVNPNGSEWEFKQRVNCFVRRKVG